MFLALLSLAVVGTLLFFTVLAFYHKKKEFLAVERGKGVAGKTAGQQAVVAESGTSIESYIPVLHVDEPVPGLSVRDLVHYHGFGTLYALDSPADPAELTIIQEELAPVVEGKLLLTSKYILVCNGDIRKKIFLSSIEKHHFQKPFLVMKRKRVKKKRDILKISERPIEFQYIFHAII